MRFSQRDLKILLRTEELIRSAAADAADAEIEPGELHLSPDACRRIIQLPPLVRCGHRLETTIREALALANEALTRKGRSYANNSRYHLGSFIAEAASIYLYLGFTVTGIAIDRLAPAFSVRLIERGLSGLQSH